VTTIAFFNNKGGVGKTSLVYHLAWMYADIGVSAVAADLDPQANLTAMFLSEDSLESLWSTNFDTIYEAIEPLLEGTGDIASPMVQSMSSLLGLIPGDLRLSLAEGELSGQWADCLDGKGRAFRVISAIWRIIEEAGTKRDATVVLIDVGPNLGALNRAALIAADYVVIPLGPDLYSLQGLRNLGPTLRTWRSEWNERAKKNSVANLSMPSGAIVPAGYIVLQHAIRLDRPVQAYERWINQIPAVYREAVLNDACGGAPARVADDPHCLATLKHYRSLMPLAQEARKPMFYLKAADGAIGGHAQAVADCYRDFRELAIRVASSCGVALE
jgi:chromosome partitioning protein